MAAPRVPIADLPEQVTATDTDLLVVQNGPTTKKMTVSKLTAVSNGAVDAHIADASAAHAASAVSAAPSGGVMTGADVQAQLGQASTAIAGLTTGKQAADPDLTTIAGLTATTDNVIQSVANAWSSRTPAQLKTTLALTKGDVGLGNVDNTSDASKPISTAQAAVNAAKADKITAINTTAPLAGGGDLSAARTLSVANFTTSDRGHRPRFGWWHRELPARRRDVVPACTVRRRRRRTSGTSDQHRHSADRWRRSVCGPDDRFEAGGARPRLHRRRLVVPDQRQRDDQHHHGGRGRQHRLSNMAGTSLKGNPAGGFGQPQDMTVAAVRTMLGTVTNGGGVATIVTLTQAAYDALGSKVATTLYIVVG